MPKQTAKNNELLRKAKRVYRKATYSYVSRTLNAEGETAAREYMAWMMPQTLDEYLDQMGKLYDNMKEWPTR